MQVKLKSPQKLDNLIADLHNYAPDAVLTKGARVNVFCLPTFVRGTAQELAQLREICKRGDKELVVIINRYGSGEAPRLPKYPELGNQAIEILIKGYPMTPDEIAPLLELLSDPKPALELKSCKSFY